MRVKNTTYKKGITMDYSQPLITWVVEHVELPIDNPQLVETFSRTTLGLSLMVIMKT